MSCTRPNLFLATLATLATLAAAWTGCASSPATPESAVSTRSTDTGPAARDGTTGGKPTASDADATRSASTAGAGAGNAAVVATDANPGGAVFPPSTRPHADWPEAKVARGNRTQDPSGMSLLETPEFKQRFAESYLAESDVEPPVTQDERVAMTEALELIGQKKLAEAEVVVRKARTDSQKGALDFMLGHILFQSERYDDAAAAYQGAVGKFPRYRRAWQALGQVWFQKQEHRKLVGSLTRVVELGGASAVTYGLLGVAYSKLGQHASAESAFRMAVLLDPDTRDWKMGLAECFFRQERFTDVVALCKSLLAEQPDSAQIWLIQANAYIGLEKPLAAAENFELVDRLGGATADQLNTLGNIYVNEKLFSMAASAYARSMEKDTKTGRSDCKRGIRAAQALASRGGLEEARQVVARVEALHGANLQPEDRKEVLRLRARIALAEGGTDEQATILEDLVKLDPFDGEALILLGRHHGRKEQTPQAIAFFERAAALPEFECKAKLAHAELLVRQKKYRDALPLLRRSQELQPRDAVQEFLEKVERAANNR